MEIKAVPHGSPEYLEAVELRRKVLRYPLGLDLTPDDLADEAGDIHFVAIDEGRVVGCLVMVPLSSGIVKMRQVAVEPELQGRGIGGEMVAASEVWARAEGYRHIELNARDTAVDFYLRLDYELEGGPFEEVTIPHQKMVKGL
jgi:predicted GNAT family N-acyltransferase